MHMLLDGQSGRAGPPSISHMRPSAQRELSGRCRVDTHAESVRGRSHEMSIVEITAFLLPRSSLSRCEGLACRPSDSIHSQRVGPPL